MNGDEPLREGEPFRILGPSRIRISAEALEMGRLQGLDARTLARHLLNQDALRQAGDIQRDGEN
jgi:hypothetical protein